MSRLVLTAFRTIAAIEAITWAGLLTGMFFKYVVVHSEIGVQIFGMAHGIAFMVYIVVSLITWRTLRWRLGTGLLALAASIPPLGTVIFERWASSTGRIDRSQAAAEPAPQHEPA